MTQTEFPLHRYRITGIVISGRRIGKTRRSAYVSFAVGEGGYNAIQLAREDGLHAAMLENLGHTTRSLDERLIGLTPEQRYIPRKN